MPEKKEKELILHIREDGSTYVEFFPVSFSDFVIDYVYDKERREKLKEMGCRRIYCG